VRMTGNFAQLLHAFFHEWLAGQRNNSCHTVRSYRDTWRLFLRFTAARQQRPVAALRLADLTAAEVLAFWTIARRNVTSPLARATAGWRRYGASFALSRTGNRWPQANARRSCGFRSSGGRAAASIIWNLQKSRPFWPSQTARLWKANAIMRC